MAYIKKIDTDGTVSGTLGLGEIGLEKITGKLFVGDGVTVGKDGALVVNAEKADKLSANKTIELTGDVTGSVSTDLSGTATVSTTYGVAASTTVAGKVQLTDNLTDTSTTKALTAAQGKVLNVAKVVLEGVVVANDTASISRDVVTNQANFVASGTIDKQDDANVFQTVVGNEYKMANTDRFVNFDGNVLDTYGEELVTNGDFSDGTAGYVLEDNIPEMRVENGRLLMYNQTIIRQDNISVVSGKTYCIKYTIVGNSNRFVTYFRNQNGSILQDNGWDYNGDGERELVFIIPSGTTSMQFRALSQTDELKLDNISVREVATVDMTNEIPEVIVQDQATNGLVVQSSVNAGDYVVIDKEELVNANTWGDTTAGVNEVDGVISFTNPVTGSTVGHLGTYEQGLEYIVKFDITSMTSGGVHIRMPFNSSTYYTAVGSYTEVITADIASGSLSQILLQVQDATTTLTIDNISVQLKSDIYRAERYTADMYDYDDTEGSVNMILGEVLKCTGINTSGIIGHYYERLNITNPVPLGTTNLTLSANWKDLGTATNMSLLNPYYEDRTQFGITNKILATRRNDGTIKTEVCFVDTAIEDCGNAHVVMTDNGYSKLSNGLYSKGTDVVTPIGTWSTLNKGAYHPVWNYFGTNYWENTNGTSGYGILTDSPYGNSTAGAFYIGTNGNSGIRVDSSNNIVESRISGGSTAHPQGKFYDIIYPDQWIDLRTEANVVSEQDELNRVSTKAKSGQLDGIGGVVFTEQVSQVAETTATLLVGNISWYPIGSILQIWDGTTAYRRTVVSNSVNPITLDATIVKTAVKFNIGGGVKPAPSSGTALRTEVLANPTVFSQAMKDTLASGLPLMFTPNLLDDTGASNIPNGTKTVFKLNNKFTTAHQVLKSTDGGVTWTALTLTTHYTVNTITNAITFVTAPLATDMIIVSNTVVNTTTTKCDPMAVKLVGNYCTATNSHSKYKANQLVPTGKVNVGDGTNGLESRVVENVLSIGYDRVVNIGDTILFETGHNYLIGVGFGIHSFTVVTRLGSSVTITVTDAFTWATSSYWENIGSYLGTPSHSTITLDNSNSPAYKMIETIAEDSDGMAHYQVFAQEMEYNATDLDYADDIPTFPNLINGTADNLLGADRVKTIVASTPLNRYFKRG